MEKKRWKIPLNRSLKWDFNCAAAQWACEGLLNTCGFNYYWNGGIKTFLKSQNIPKYQIAIQIISFKIPFRTNQKTSTQSNIFRSSQLLFLSFPSLPPSALCHVAWTVPKHRNARFPRHFHVDIEYASWNCNDPPCNSPPYMLQMCSIYNMDIWTM